MNSCTHELTATKEQSKTHVLRRQGSCPKQENIAKPRRPSYSSQICQSSKSSHLSRNRVDKGTERGQEFHPLVPFTGREHEEWGKACHSNKTSCMWGHAPVHAHVYRDMTRTRMLHIVCRAWFTEISAHTRNRAIVSALTDSTQPTLAP